MCQSYGTVATKSDAICFDFSRYKSVGMGPVEKNRDFGYISSYFSTLNYDFLEFT